MSGRFVRASKFRHVHGDAAKPEKCFTGVAAVQSGDGQIMSTNGRYIAYPAKGGGGPMAVWPVDRPMRTPTSFKTINVMKSKVLVSSWSPFVSNLLAMGSDSGLALSLVPDGGSAEMKESVSAATADLKGHQKKVVALAFHPTAQNTLASGSYDNTVKLWDCAAQAASFSNTFPDSIVDLSWNTDGSLMAASCKDKNMYLFDPRQQDSVAKVQAFESAKIFRAFCLDAGRVGVVGFTKRATRKLRFFDERKLDAPIFEEDVDGGSGNFTAHFDPDTKVLFLAGKGDATIKYYEILDKAYFLTEFRDNQSQKAVCWTPKRFCNVLNCEIARVHRLKNDVIQPVSFLVPRKSDLFQEDLYPETYAGKHAQTHDEWKGGQNVPPPLVSMDPSKRQDVQEDAAAFVAEKSPSELKAELEAANKRIAELEAELAALKAS